MSGRRAILRSATQRRERASLDDPPVDSLTWKNFVSVLATNSSLPQLANL